MPIEATNGLSPDVPANDAPAGTLRPISARRAASASPRTRRSARRGRIAGCPCRRLVRRHRLRGDRDVGLPVDVRFDHLGVVHPVEMIAGQDQVVVGLVAREVPRGLADGVGRALKPAGVVGRLLGRQDLDEALAEQIHPVGLRDVPVQRRRVELRQDEDPPDVGVQAVADRDVDQTVFARQSARPASIDAASAGRAASLVRRRARARELRCEGPSGVRHPTSARVVLLFHSARSTLSFPSGGSHEHAVSCLGRPARGCRRFPCWPGASQIVDRSKNGLGRSRHFRPVHDGR